MNQKENNETKVMSAEELAMKTLADALPEECARVRALQKIYRDPIMHGAGEIAAQMMEASLREADNAMMSGDVVAMLKALEDLKGYTE